MYKQKLHLKLLTVFLSVCLLTGITPVAVAAFVQDGGNIPLTVTSSKSSATIGEEVDFTIKMGSAEGLNLGSFSFDISLPEGMTYKSGSGTINPAFKTATEMGDVRFVSNPRLMVTGYGSPGYNGGALDIASFTCTVTSTGNKTVTLVEADFYDISAKSISSSVTSVTVAVDISSESTPISDRAGLEAIKNNLSGKYHLTNNIDLGDIEWVPIGLNSNNPFTGVFDGKGYIIRNLKITEIREYAGLFGYADGAEIKNVGLVGSNINVTVPSSVYAGAVCGFNRMGGTIRNCYNTGSVAATATGDSNLPNVGGICGINNGTVSNSFNTGIVTATNTSSHISQAGGISGSLGWSGIVTDSYNTGAVTAFSASGNFSIAYAGGVIGFCNGEIRNCYNTGNLASSTGSINAYAGGICGEIFSDSVIINCFWNSDSNQTVNGTPRTNAQKRGVGDVPAGSEDTTTPLTTSQMKAKNNYIGFDLTNVWDISPTVNNGYPFLRGMTGVEDGGDGDDTTISVTGVTLDKTATTLEIGQTETLTATISPTNATDKTISWRSSNTAVVTVDATGVVTAVSKGTATITVTTNDGGKTATCSVTVIYIQPTRIMINPPHTVLTASQSEVTLSVETDPIDASPENVEWSVEPTNALIFKDDINTSREVTLEKGSYTGEATITAKAGQFTSTATVTVLDVETNDLQVKLLTSKATLNKLKDGVLVPIDIFTETKSDNTMFTAANTMSAARSTKNAPINTSLFKSITVTNPADNATFTATPVSDRYFLLSTSVDTKNKSYKGLTFDFYFNDTDKVTSATTLEAVVVEKYPKITIATNSLDLFYPGKPAKLTVTSDDGAVTVSESSSIDGVEVKNGQLWLKTVTDGKTDITKAKTAKGTLILTVDGYNKSYKTAPKISVKVTETKPKLKLAANSITVDGSDTPSTLQLISVDTSRSLESFNVIGVSGPGVVEGSYSNGYFKIVAKSTANVTLNVNFSDGGKDFPLTLKVKTATVNKPTISAKVKNVVVSSNHVGPITTIDIQANPSNLALSGMTVDDTQAPGITASRKENRLTLTTDGTEIKSGKIEVSMYINGTEKKIPIKVTVPSKPAKASVSLKGKIDVTMTDSKINATVKLTNTTSDLDKVILDRNDFTARVTGRNTFEITSKNPNLAPGVKKDVKATIKLINNNPLPQVTLKITPTQTVSKAWQSRKEVTLSTTALKNGEEIGLGLLNASVALGEVQINAKSVAKNPDFVLERNGANNVTIRLAEPTIEKSLKVQSGKSYTVKLELWPKGAYEIDTDNNDKAKLDKDGNLIALGKGKPTVVSVKVNVK